MPVEEKAKGSTLVILLLLTSLTLFVASAFIFHTTDVRDATYYDPEWFLENSRAMKPPMLSISPPPASPNITLEYFFEIDGRPPKLAWRYYVLSEYILGYGWWVGYNVEEKYVCEFRSNLTFTVRTPILPAGWLYDYPLVALWDNRVEVACTDFEVYSSDIYSFDMNVGIRLPDDIISVHVTAPEEGMLGVAYSVHYWPKNYTEIIMNSSTLRDVRQMVATDSVLRNYTRIPAGYLSRFPEVREVLERIALPENETVYAQVSTTMWYLIRNFYVAYNYSCLLYTSPIPRDRG